MILLHLVAAGLYGVLAAYFWRTRWLAQPTPRPQGLSTGERVAVLLALCLHIWLLNAAIFEEGRMRFGFALALSTMVWLAALIYWVESFFHHIDGMQALVLPLAAAGVVLPVFFPGTHLLTNFDSPTFRGHFLVAMLAYSLFTIAALHATLMAVLERSLHGGKLSGAVGGALLSLPPLLTMERVLFRIIWIGFLLLTVTLASGILFSETLFGKALGFNHKTVFGFTSWGIFAALLAGRHVYGWRGRSALRWTLAGFVALLLAYVGTRFVLEVILGRQ
jgi:ABC-type uncharacterized transport system permease subunit